MVLFQSNPEGVISKVNLDAFILLEQGSFKLKQRRDNGQINTIPLQLILRQKDEAFVFPIIDQDLFSQFINEQEGLTGSIWLLSGGWALSTRASTLASFIAKVKEHGDMSFIMRVEELETATAA